MKKLAWLRPFALPLLAALLAHAGSLRDGFVLDDDNLLVQNPYVRSLSGLGKLVSSGLFEASAHPILVDYYRPLSGALYWLTWHLFGDSAPAQHAFNVALHGAVVFAFVRLLIGLDVRPALATFAATLFAVHPATGDIVAYVGGRQDMLGWLIALASMHALVRGGSAPKAAVVTFLGVSLATFSRESFALLAVLLPVAASLRGQLDRKRLAVTGGAAALAGVAVIAARRAAGVAFNAQAESSQGDWLRVGAGSAARLLRDALLPTDLAVDVTIFPLSWGATLALFAAIALVLAGILRVRPPKLRLAATLGALMLTLLLLAHAPIAVRSGFISDRYAYPIVLAVALLVAVVAETFATRLDEDKSKSPLLSLAPAFPFVMALALAPATWARELEWKDERTLQAAMFTARPDDPESQYAEGVLRMSEHDWDGAYALCARYDEVHPRSHRADYCVGKCLFFEGKPKEAAEKLSAYLEERPANADARHLLLASLFAIEDLDGVARTLDGWSPELDDDPEVQAARAELSRRRRRASP